MITNQNSVGRAATRLGSVGIAIVGLLSLAFGAGSEVARESSQRPVSGQIKSAPVGVVVDQSTGPVTMTPVDGPKTPAEAPSFFLNWYSVNGGGETQLSSPSYRLGASVAQTAAGEISSPSYILNLGFWQPFAGGSGSCCVGRVGDANGSGADEPTIGDLSAIIDALFIGNDWSVIPCLTEGDINQSGGTDPATTDITIGDVSYLIDYLFITGSGLGLPACL